MATNIIAQDRFLAFWPWNFGIIISVLFGTAVGLLVKYILDKRYIFRFRAKNIVHDSKTFALYMAMGGVTTCIFWGSECASYLLWQTTNARYTGGIIGLTVGYWLKFHLDKKFVFDGGKR